MNRLAHGVALLLLTVTAVAAQDADVLREIEDLKKGQAEIRRDLAEIKRLLATQRAPVAAAGQNVRGLIVDLGDNPVKGAATATVTLVEFTDYQCPYCARHARDTLPQIVREYIDTGRVRYAVLNLPLEQIHPQAFAASVAAACAAEQDRYWEMHDRLFARQKEFDSFRPHAQALGLDTAAFEQCVGSGRHDATVRRDMEEARKVGLGSTPSFLLATTNPANPRKVTGISSLRGAVPFAQFKSALDAALARAAARPIPSNIR